MNKETLKTLGLGMAIICIIGLIGTAISLWQIAGQIFLILLIAVIGCWFAWFVGDFVREIWEEEYRSRHPRKNHDK